MSGHSKWANIKRKKEVEDAKRGRLFTKLARDITVAAKEGGGDINANPTLRSAVEKAKAGNLPKDRIQRAIARGTGTLSGDAVEAIYEGYGPAGVAILISVVTNNKNRTLSEIRGVLSRSGSSLAEAGSVSYIFRGNPPKPSFTIPLNEEDRAKFERLRKSLLEIDDITSVSHNAQI